ncbi:MAG: hypothetical protein DMG01_09485 [Acidobacteria bacterium]|nr:MAG: hypothetical protein DMG01_09485 [Acidobacteriota bacterium]
MALARADLESLLRARQLDRTLTTTLPPVEYDAAACGITALDVHLGGGFPRGQVSELVGPRSSGRTSLLHRMLAAATAHGELVALVDALDMFDVESASAAGIHLDRLLWIRGHVVSNPGMCRDMNQRALEQALRAFTLVLQAGNFGLVAFDVAEAPSHAIRRLPFTTWLRLQRMVEGSQTICLLVGSEPMARSSAGLTVKVGQRSEGKGQRFASSARVGDVLSWMRTTAATISDALFLIHATATARVRQGTANSKICDVLFQIRARTTARGHLRVGAATTVCDVLF